MQPDATQYVFFPLYQNKPLSSVRVNNPALEGKADKGVPEYSQDPKVYHKDKCIRHSVPGVPSLVAGVVACAAADDDHGLKVNVKSGHQDPG